MAPLVASHLVLVSRLLQGNRMLKLAFLALVLALAACSTAPVVKAPGQPAAVAEPEIRPLLERLYRSFNYGPRQEPDWRSMRACFIDGAQFVPEPPAGEPIRSYDVDALIAKWKSSMRRSKSANPGYSEWIDSTTITRTGDMLRVDVVFYGKEPGDPHPRRPGLDSLLLARSAGSWKVLSFVVQSESKL